MIQINNKKRKIVKLLSMNCYCDIVNTFDDSGAGEKCLCKADIFRAGKSPITMIFEVDSADLIKRESFGGSNERL